MNIENLSHIEDIKNFLSGSQAVAYSIAADKAARYNWIRKTLIKHGYISLSKCDKGIITQFISKISGYSRQQVSRLIKQYKQTGRIEYHQRTTNGFKKYYTRDDIHLLARTDEIHPVNNGAAIKKICERAYQVYDQNEYKHLANISISHLYNLRQTKAYQQVRRNFDKTKSKTSSIGERRKPQPSGQPGYIRIDTVHQGDLDGVKGVYHINAVDEVTQFEVVASVEKISEAYLIPVLEQMIEQFPFTIISWHSDNGSEYINQNVARLLKKLFIEMTKSRPRHSNDNALAESKNASVVRNVFGYDHLPQKSAEIINEFNQAYLNPYINYHRPCLFPETITNDKGKEIKKYPYKKVSTPYEKLKSLPNAKQFLKNGIDFKQLDLIANKISDNEAAKVLHFKRNLLFKLIFEQSKRLA
jgi:hypothetical protein